MDEIEGGGGGGPLVEAADVLVAPSEPEYPESSFDSVQGAWEAASQGIGVLRSITNVVSAAVDRLFGGDFGMQLSEEILGEWWKLPMVAEAWRNIAESQRVVQNDLLDRVYTVVGNRWTGQANEYFTTNMAGWTAAFDNNIALAEWVAGECEVAAEDFHAMVDALADAFNTVKDALIEAGLIIGGATIIGSLLGSGLGGALTGALVSSTQVSKIVAAVDAAAAIVDTIFEIANFVSDAFTMAETEGVQTFLPTYNTDSDEWEDR